MADIKHEFFDNRTVSDDLDEAKAWMVHGTVTNVINHAQASYCQIVITDVGLVATDDGCGIGDARQGNDMASMRRRVASYGAQLIIGLGSQGKGTQITVKN